MTVFDYAVIGIIAFSMLLSLLRGLVKEIFSLMAWVLAWATANYFSAEIVPLLPANVEAGLRPSVAYITVFVGVLLLVSAISMLVALLVKSVGLGWADRLLGSVFGLLRGGVIVLLAVLLAGMTALPRSVFWQEALFSKPLESVASSVKSWLPDDLSKRIIYD